MKMFKSKQKNSLQKDSESFGGKGPKKNKDPRVKSEAG